MDIVPAVSTAAFVGKKFDKVLTGNVHSYWKFIVAPPSFSFLLAAYHLRHFPRQISLLT